MKYEPVIEKLENDGWSDYIEPPKGELRLACCGCGLVHDVQMVAEPLVENPRTLVRLKRNNRATGQLRRHSGG